MHDSLGDAFMVKSMDLIQLENKPIPKSQLDNKLV